MMNSRRKLGKKPARLGAVKFQLQNYVDLSKLPTPPEEFGHEVALTDWGVLANEDFGCCVWSGAAHETQLWRKEAHLYYGFTDHAVLSDYSAVTGFNPADPNTDQGTDMQQAAEYRRTIGIVDALGWRHRVVAYMAIEPGNLDQLYVATYIFGAVGVGIRFPSSAMDQFDQGKPWSVVPNAPIEGGHYIPSVGRRGGLIQVVTWGKTHQMTPEFFQANCDEAIVYLTIENLLLGKTPEGFNMTQLLADLGALKPVAASMAMAGHHVPPPCDPLTDAISELTEEISALTQELKKRKQRLFVLGFGPDQPITKG